MSEKVSFDPLVHAYLEDGKSFVRKTALENNRKAQEEADVKNQKLLHRFFRKKDVQAIDILHYKALMDQVEDLYWTVPGDSNPNPFAPCFIHGTLEGKPFQVLSNGKDSFHGDKVFNRQDAKDLYSSLYHLVHDKQERERKKIEKIHKEEERLEEKSKQILKLEPSDSPNITSELPKARVHIPKKPK